MTEEMLRTIESIVYEEEMQPHLWCSRERRLERMGLAGAGERERWEVIKDVRDCADAYGYVMGRYLFSVVAPAARRGDRESPEGCPDWFYQLACCAARKDGSYFYYLPLHLYDIYFDHLMRDEGFRRYRELFEEECGLVPNEETGYKKLNEDNVNRFLITWGALYDYDFGRNRWKYPDEDGTGSLTDLCIRTGIKTGFCKGAVYSALMGECGPYEDVSLSEAVRELFNDHMNDRMLVLRVLGLIGNGRFPMPTDAAELFLSLHDLIVDLLLERVNRVRIGAEVENEEEEDSGDDREG